MKKQILDILKISCRLSAEEIAVMLATTPEGRRSN